MKLSDINTIKNDIKRAETIADIKRGDYLDNIVKAVEDKLK